MAKKKLINIFNAPKSRTNFSRPENAANADNMDDFNIVDSINVNSGTIQNAPVNAKDIVNKAYADGLGGGDWTVSQAPAVIHPDNYTDTDTQLSEGDITAMGFTKDVEVDWTADQSPAVINAANYVDNDTTDHTALSNIGTLTHAEIETELTALSGVTVVNSAKVSYTDAAQFQTLSGAYIAHAADSSDPHGAALTQTTITATNISGTSITKTGDQTISGVAFVPNIVFGTVSGLHTASDYPQGSVLVIYS